jgi:hypothetical protein
MAESETPSLVFRKTSFTIRHRFAPASPCSTFTRMRANFRFVRFSPSVSSRLRGFFFRLAGFLYCRLVALKSRILVQHRPWRILNLLVIRYLFIVRFADVGLTQKSDAFALRIHDNDILIAMRFLLAAVVRRLFLWVFRPLTPPFGPVDDKSRSRFGCEAVLCEVHGIPLRESPKVIQGRAEGRQQAMNPVVCLRLTQAEEFSQDNLEGVGFQINQEKQQLLFGARKRTASPTPSKALARLPVHGLIDRAQTIISPVEGSQQRFKLPRGQPSESQKLSAIHLEVYVV